MNVGIRKNVNEIYRIKKPCKKKIRNTNTQLVVNLGTLTGKLFKTSFRDY